MDKSLGKHRYSIFTLTKLAKDRFMKVDDFLQFLLFCQILTTRGEIIFTLYPNVLYSRHRGRIGKNIQLFLIPMIEISLNCVQKKNF